MLSRTLTDQPASCDRAVASARPEGGYHDNSAPPISASGSRCCRPVGDLADRTGAELSGADGAHHRASSCRRHVRHVRAPAGSMAVGAARPAIHRREPAGRRHQYRHRGGRARGPGRLHAPRNDREQRHQRDDLRQAQFQFHPRHRAGGPHHPRAPCAGGASVGSGHRRFRSSSLMRRPTRARSIWRRPATAPPLMWPANYSA